MGASKSVEHIGRIASIEGNKLIVQFLAQSACASCHAKGACSAADMENKEVEVLEPHPDRYQLGEKVKIVLKQSLGFRALLLGYLMPFFLVLIVLVVLTQFTTEGKAGLGSLAVLPPYYLFLFLMKDRLKKTFTFSIKKSD